MPPRNDPPPVPDPEPGFEEALERLEGIVEDLEGGQLTLEQSLERYEEGMKLSRRLARTLDEAEKTVERLVEADAADSDPSRIAEPPSPRARKGTHPVELESGRSGESELPF